MDGQGTAAFPAPAGGRPREVRLGSVDATSRLASASDVVSAGVGDVEAPDGEDSNVMVAPGNPEGASPDADLPPAPWSRPAEPGPEESQPPQAELPSQQIEPDNTDNIADPEQGNAAVARDENTGHNQAAESPVTQPRVAEAPAVPALPKRIPDREPPTEQFAAVPA